jgi:hypothetical protein
MLRNLTTAAQIEVGRSGGLEALLRICTGSQLQHQQQHTLYHPQLLEGAHSDSAAALIATARKAATSTAAAAVADSNSQQQQQQQQLLLPALWALRTAVHNCKPNQDKLLRLRGVEALVQLLEVPTRSDSPQQGDAPTAAATAAVAAAALTALTAAVRGHERACRRLLRVGLDALIDLAEAAGPAQQQQQQQQRLQQQVSSDVHEAHCAAISQHWGCDPAALDRAACSLTQLQQHSAM